MEERQDIMGSDGLLHCSECGEAVEKEMDWPLMDGQGTKVKKKFHVMCSCRIKEREEEERRRELQDQQRRVDELRNLSLLDAKSKDVKFATYQKTEQNAKVFGIAKNYVENFDKMFQESQGLLFWGNVGTGKSYTAAAIANELIDRLQPVIMTSFVKLLEDMKGFDTDEGAYLRRLNQAKLLIIDDLGAERGTDYSLEKVYDIVDSRYRTGKPVVFTTNLTMREMKECTDIRYNRIYDRIFEMCYPVKFDGLSWRKKDAAERYAEMKKLLEG